MLPTVQHFYRALLRFEYTAHQYERLIHEDPVRYSRLLIPLRESKEKQARIESILSKRPDNPPTAEEKLQINRHIIKNELRKAEGGLCLGCSFYLPNQLSTEFGYAGMIKKLETIPENTIACISTEIRLSEPTRTQCDFYTEDLHALGLTDFRDPEDHIAAWLWLSEKYGKTQEPANPERVHKE